MNVKQLFTDDRAVSPVVGVALLIAITVILAAVIGGVVLGLGTSSADAPQASISFENESGALYANHDGGDQLTGSHVIVRTTGAATGEGINDMAAGDRQQVASGVTGGDTVAIVWQDPNSDEEQVLAEFEA